MRIFIVDDGVGAFATLNKLRYSLNVDYTVKILDDSFPLGNLHGAKLLSVAKEQLAQAAELNCDAVVFSSIALSMASVRALAATSPLPVFGCEAPVLHASTYTASKVLAVGDEFVTQQVRRLQNVIPLPMKEFPTLAENNACDRTVVSYISDTAEKYYGSFDCIALGCSCMNNYKHCFSRVFPNTQIFDSLEGVARKMRKKFKKISNLEGSVTILSQSGKKISEKYNFFIDEFL